MASAQSKLSDIVLMSGGELSAAIKAKRVSCIEVMNAYLGHIAHLNPKVNAIVSLQDRSDLFEASARTRCATGARRILSGGCTVFRKPSRIWRRSRASAWRWDRRILKDFIAPVDAIFVERMKRAGSIIIGKTNTPEFGLGSQTYNPVFGTTLNAYDQDQGRRRHLAAAARPSR